MIAFDGSLADLDDTVYNMSAAQAWLTGRPCVEVFDDAWLRSHEVTIRVTAVGKRHLTANTRNGFRIPHKEEPC